MRRRFWFKSQDRNFGLILSQKFLEMTNYKSVQQYFVFKWYLRWNTNFLDSAVDVTVFCECILCLCFSNRWSRVRGIYWRVSGCAVDSPYLRWCCRACGASWMTLSGSAPRRPTLSSTSMSAPSSTGCGQLYSSSTVYPSETPSSLSSKYTGC